jgi:indoleamine 2,3-dioxygenase
MAPLFSSSGSKLADYRVDTEVGFFPSREHGALPPPFSLWEEALDTARISVSLGDDASLKAEAQRQSSCRWREAVSSVSKCCKHRTNIFHRVSQFEILATESLQNDYHLLERSHHVLAFLVHYYVHSSPTQNNTTKVMVPASLTVPLVEVSKHLGIAPVLTFADTVLWNVSPIDPKAGFHISNLKCKHLFSGLPDEEAFYLTSAAIELRGVEFLRQLEVLFRGPVTAQLYRSLLDNITQTIGDLTKILEGVRDHCHPRTFYNSVRPWFRGSPQDEEGRNCWVYEGVDPLETQDLSGPSAGQSSVMHALDVMLDIDHTLTEQRYPEPSPMNLRADTQFMQRMWRYMPGRHREFLKFLQEHGCFREVAKSQVELADSYNEAVLALKRFRDAHIRIAVLYIISMARSPDQNSVKDSVGTSRQVQGTGGTELATLLKSTRDATTRATLPPS